MAEKQKGFISINDRPLILKLRSLGAGVEEQDETLISCLEAAYFAERGVLPMKKDALIKDALKTDKLAKEKYHVLRYLRERGYIVRPSLDGTPYLRLHRKGYRPGEDKTQYLIAVSKKGKALDRLALVESLEAAGRLRKELLVAIVDPKEERPAFLKFSRMDFE